jgi:hypothetical protein
MTWSYLSPVERVTGAKRHAVEAIDEDKPLEKATIGIVALVYFD